VFVDRNIVGNVFTAILLLFVLLFKKLSIYLDPWLGW